MLMLLSPAKTLDFETPAKTKTATSPDFLTDSQALIDELRVLSANDISQLMGISEQLGELNYRRFQDWAPPFDGNNAKQALLAFKGDVYTGLAADEFSAADLKYAQKHLRILSGLYGLLRPLDYIQAYRLEMGTRFNNQRGSNLYQFWGDKITATLNQELARSKSDIVLNLASNEYFKAVKPKLLAAELYSPVFKDLKNGDYKIISFYAKKARGLMAAYVIKNRIDDIEAVKGFNLAGYRYNKRLSEGKKWVFTRDEPQ